MLYENRYKGISVYTCAHLSIVCTYFVHPYCISPIFFFSHKCANGVEVKQESKWHTSEGWQTMETQTNPWCSVTLSHTSDECSSLCQRTTFPHFLSSASSNPPFLSPGLFSTPTRLPLKTTYEDHLRSHHETPDESVSLISPCTEVDVTLFLEPLSHKWNIKAPLFSTAIGNFI